MPSEARKSWDELLIETLGPTPLVVARNARSRDFRRLRNELRGADLSAVSEVVERVCKERSIVQICRTGANAYIGVPIICPDNTISGVHVRYGPEVPSAAPRVAAFHWDLSTPTGVPRLHLESDFLEMIEIPVESRDRSVYGPLDFCGRVARIRDLIGIWEDVACAGPGTATVGRLLLQTATDELLMLQYAMKFVETDVGPRLRVLCQDVSDSISMDDIRLDMVDVGIASAAITATGMFGALIDARWKVPVAIKWLTPYFAGTGHGVSTGQAVGLHPDDLARAPELIAKVLAGETVTDQMRNRDPAGGWKRSTFIARMVDPISAPTLVLVLFVPGPTEPASPSALYLPLSAPPGETI